jgi:hypothetical protein
MALNNEAWLRVAMLGDAAGAGDLAELALSLCRMLGDQRGIAQSLATIAAVEASRCNPNAVATLREGIRLAVAVQDRWIAAQLQLQEAEMLTMRSAFADAAEAAVRAAKEAANAELPDLQDAARIWQALIATRSGDPALGKTLLDRGKPSANWHLHLYWLAIAETERMNSNWKDADAAIRSAHSEMQRLLADVPEHLRAQALTDVPVFASIREHFESRRTKVAQALVPSVETPRGKVPTPEQCVWVDWEWWIPSDDVLNPIARRRRRLARFLDSCDRQGARPTIPHMATALDTSVATVRRDLKALRANSEQQHS